MNSEIGSRLTYGRRTNKKKHSFPFKERWRCKEVWHLPLRCCFLAEKKAQIAGILPLQGPVSDGSSPQAKARGEKQFNRTSNKVSSTLRPPCCTLSPSVTSTEGSDTMLFLLLLLLLHSMLHRRSYLARSVLEETHCCDERSRLRIQRYPQIPLIP